MNKGKADGRINSELRFLLYNNKELSSYNPLYYLETFNQINSNQQPDLIFFGRFSVRTKLSG